MSGKKTVTGADLLVGSLEDQGIERVFNIPGFGILPFVESVYRSDSLKYTSSLNETAVTFIAEGYGRATRKPAFVNVYQSTGTGFGMPAISVAWAERTPMIFATTTNSRTLEGRDQYAAVPKRITASTDQYTKWSFEVQSADRIPEAIGRAVSIATSPPMGPVHLAFPMDVYEEHVPLDQIDGRWGRTERYHGSRPDDTGIEQAADLLVDGRRPVILAGAEAGKHYANKELQTLAELIDAAVIVEGKTTYLPFPNDHPRYVGRATGGDYGSVSAAIETADTLLFVCFELTETIRDQYQLFDTDADIVQFATTPADIGKQVVPDVSLVAHPKAGLADLSDVIATQKTVAESDADFITEHRTAHTRRLEQARDDLADRMDQNRPTPIEALLSTARSVSDDDLTIVHDAGDEIPFVDAISLDSPDSHHGISMKASVQGWAIPAGIGVQLGNPDRDVLVLEGDGGFMFTGPNALYTAAVYNIPLTVAVIDNRGWRAGGYNDKIGLGWDVETFLGRFSDPPLDFRSIADGVGIETYEIDGGDQAEARLEQAFTSDRPSLIKVSAGYRP